MFSSDQNISSLKDFIIEVKEYLCLRYDLVKLDLVSKFTILAATLFLCVVMLFFLGIALLFASYSAAKGLVVLTDSEPLAYLLVAAAYVLMAVVVYTQRKRLIIQPIAKFLSDLFLEPLNKEEDKNEQK